MYNSYTTKNMDNNYNISLILFSQINAYVFVYIYIYVFAYMCMLYMYIFVYIQKEESTYNQIKKYIYNGRRNTEADVLHKQKMYNYD